MSFSLNQLYEVLGISKQAVSQYERRKQRFDTRIEELITQAQAIRQKHPGCGVKKMYYQLKPSFMGRDKFIEIMMQSGFRLIRTKNARRTTKTGKVWYVNLIKGMQLQEPYCVWQSDITYVAIGSSFYYVVFIEDVYTKVIVGYEISCDLRATMNIKALKMALRYYPAPQIHHSDRGSQYSSNEYVRILKSHNISISMGLTATENAYAERLNRTIKEEYLDHWRPHSYKELRKQIHKAVKNYNNKRPHHQLNNMSPKEFENRCLADSSFNKPMLTIFDNNKS